MAELSSARYGKDNIRLFKKKRNADGTEDVAEMTVCTLLEGEIDESLVPVIIIGAVAEVLQEYSYKTADNSVVVPTDTQKQTTYIFAKNNPVEPPEVFGATLAQHFLDKYGHIHAAHVKIIQHRWTRMTVDGKPHPHSFYRDGEEVRTLELVARDEKYGGGICIKSGIDKLLVLKSTGSAFYGYNTDDYTILKETDDRILSTEIKCAWIWKTFSGLQEVKFRQSEFNRAFNEARDITFKTFANDNSASVQNTMYKMCEQILAAVLGVDVVDYSLPNKHYFEIDLSWHHGLKNTGKDAEVYAPQSNPNGLIQCSVARKGSALGKAKL